MPDQTPAPGPVAIDPRVAASTTPEPAASRAAGSTPVTAGRLQRAAAEMFEVLGEEFAEQRPESGLLTLLSAYAEAAAEAQDLPWNPEVADGILEAAYRGLQRAYRRGPSRAPDRSLLAARFDVMAVERQQVWLAQAALWLYGTGDPDAYGPPPGAEPTSTPPAWP